MRPAGGDPSASREVENLADDGRRAELRTPFLRPEDGMQHPVLEPSDDTRHKVFQPGDIRHEVHISGTNFWECTFNLTKVILGAGIMALPRAVALLGWGPGLALLLVVGVLTHFTVHGLVYASDQCGRDTYSALVRHALGPLAERVLQTMMLLGCLGFEVVYVDIIGDLLVGEEPDLDGLITSWMPPDMRRQWWVGRPVVLAALTALVLAPLASKRTMGHLGAVNVVGLLSLLAFAAATCWLGAAAVVRGSAHVLPAGPDLQGLGPDAVSRVTGVLAVVPILLTAASCHQSVHPLRTMLTPYSPAVLDRVVALSLSLVTVLFVVVCGAAYTAFGADVRGNFLNNLAPPLLAPLIGQRTATVVAMGVRGGYAVSLVGSSVLIMFPLRQSVLELIVPNQGGGGSPVSTLLYLGSTYGLLASAYGIAIFVPSIWDVISFVGAVAVTIICFIIPALLIVKYKNRRTLSHAVQRGAAWVVAALGMLLFANIFVQMYLSAGRHGAPQPPPSGGAPPPLFSPPPPTPPPAT